MENIFEKLDLSGIEKAIMEDNCTIEISIITPKTKNLVIKNQDGNTSNHYGLNISFIPMIARFSKDYANNNERICYDDDDSLRSIIDLQLLRQKILIIEKEQDSYKSTLKKWDKKPIISITNKNLANALNEIDSYIDNLSINDLLFLHKTNLDKINIDNIYNEAKNNKKQTTRIRK